jgi:hypothetical protein
LAARQRLNDSAVLGIDGREIFEQPQEITERAARRRRFHGHDNQIVRDGPGRESLELG